MHWILIIMMSTGTFKKVKFNSEDACQLVRKEVLALGSPKHAMVKCIYDKGGK